MLCNNIALEEGTLLKFSSDEELGLDSSDTTATDEVQYILLSFV